MWASIRNVWHDHTKGLGWMFGRSACSNFGHNYIQMQYQISSICICYYTHRTHLGFHMNYLSHVKDILTSCPLIHCFWQMYNVTKMVDIAAVPRQMVHLVHPLEKVSLAKSPYTYCKSEQAIFCVQWSLVTSSVLHCLGLINIIIVLL